MIDNRRKAPDSFMPLWIADYLADTGHLTTEQDGAYLHLLMGYWRRKCVGLPDDDAFLCQLTKLSKHKWRFIKPIVGAFFDIRDGVWRNNRADAEWAKAIKLKDAKSAAGTKGAEVTNAKRAGRAVYTKPHSVRESSANSQGGDVVMSPQILDGDIVPQTADLSHVNLGTADAVLSANGSANERPTPSPIRTRTTVSSNSETLSLVEPLLVSPNGKTPPRPASKPISSKRDRGTRWTAEVVSEEWIVAAIAAYPMVDCRAEAVAFVNFWISCSTPNAWKLNWRAAWMNWCGRDQKRLKERNAYVRPNGNGHAQGQLGATSKFQDDLKRELADLDAAERSRAH